MSQSTQSFPPPYVGGPTPTGQNEGVLPLVLGIVSFVIGWVLVLGLVVGALAVWLGLRARSLVARGQLLGAGAAITGVVLGAVAAQTSLVVTIALIGGAAGGSSDTASSSRPVSTATEAPSPSRNARRSAENHLDFGAFSRSGLINQLEFEGFSSHDAMWVVDGLAIDDNAQAAKKAENHLGCSGLIDQLDFEGYAPEQAGFGVSQVGL